ncbi:hypothetical protein M8C21_001122 [Ambrosia artemisiifolia]|uniref:Malectin-like domain-containing protein n=1 Tax=Ambrosia artemisiifolia TaxID=4212 RepID=A0AAD5BQB2_AMBAR|nr:hypothetical protein M8C21_001122 [Ambrosia artemisiifolia]
MGILFSLVLLHAAAMIYAQDGFISLDCGSPPGTKYTEKGVNYVSDDGFIDSGATNDTIHPNNYFPRAYRSHRSFPENEWNCYTLRPQKGKNNRYLIRAMFVYGGDKGPAPLFDLYIGAEYWTTHINSKPANPIYYELIHLTSSDYINVCLVNTGDGSPYITSLELRPLDITMYEYQKKSLFCFPGHLNFGADVFMRYDDDKYDRLWEPISLEGCKAVQTSDRVTLGPNNVEQVPSKVMSTAITPINSKGSIVFSFESLNTADECIFYIYLAEVQKLETNQKREVNIYINGKRNGPFLVSTNMSTIRSETYSGSSSYTLIINNTLNSTLPPILNALEVFNLMQVRQNQTVDKDAAAIWSTKSTYGLLKLNWQGDPCVPQAWVGLNCNYSGQGAVNIISLNLSSRGLNGEIATALANLTMLESLDLSYNNLTGNVPEFLGQLDNLKIL